MQRPTVSRPLRTARPIESVGELCRDPDTLWVTTGTNPFCRLDDERAALEAPARTSR